MPVPPSCYSLDLPELGMADLVSSAVLQQSTAGKKCLDVFVSHRKAAITDRESEAHPSASSHGADSVLSNGTKLKTNQNPHSNHI